MQVIPVKDVKNPADEETYLLPLSTVSRNTSSRRILRYPPKAFRLRRENVNLEEGFNLHSVCGGSDLGFLLNGHAQMLNMSIIKSASILDSPLGAKRKKDVSREIIPTNTSRLVCNDSSMCVILSGELSALNKHDEYMQRLQNNELSFLRSEIDSLRGMVGNITEKEKIQRHLAISGRTSIWLALHHLVHHLPKPIRDGLWDENESFDGHIRHLHKTLTAVSYNCAEVELHDQKAFDEYLSKDEAAKYYYQEIWAAHKGEKDVYVPLEVYKGLAVLMSALIIYYDKLKDSLDLHINQTSQTKNQTGYRLYDYDVIWHVKQETKEQTFASLSKLNEKVRKGHLKRLQDLATALVILSDPSLLRASLYFPYEVALHSEDLPKTSATDENTKDRFLSVMDKAWTEAEEYKEPEDAPGIADYKRLFLILGGQKDGPWTTDLKDRKPLFQVHAIGREKCNKKLPSWLGKVGLWSSNVPLPSIGSRRGPKRLEVERCRKDLHPQEIAVRDSSVKELTSQRKRSADRVSGYDLLEMRAKRAKHDA